MDEDGTAHGSHRSMTRVTPMSPYTLVDLGPNFFPHAVNAHDDIAGGTSTNRAALWSQGSVTTLHGADGGTTTGLHTGAVGTLVGQQDIGGANARSVGFETVTSSAATSPVGTDPGTHSSASAKSIADDGRIVYVFDGAYSVIGPTGGPLGFIPEGISHNGTIVGQSGASIVVRDSGGTAHTYANPELMAPAAVNDTGVVVGSTNTSAIKQRGAPDGWTFDSADSINDAGDIVGTSEDDGVAHGYLMEDSAEVVVNSTTDNAESGGAAAGACDTGQTITGGAPECTLRAAIAVVNSGHANTVSFAIPDVTTPTISPSSALPIITNPVDIDGTSQGSWVVLSGAGAGATTDGLELDGAGSTLRGMVINGFAGGAGVVAGGAGGGQTIAGNRIGTDPTGMTASSNQYGVLVLAPKVVVGGTAGTSQSACVGDCNLISSNTRGQIDNTGATLPSATTQLAATVQGNWIGVDATGHAALPATGGTDNGISFEWAADTPFTSADHLTIGGPSTSPGVAPGNLVAASETAIFTSYVGPQHPDGHLMGSISIAGNLVGESDAGQPLGSGDTGI